MRGVHLLQPDVVQLRALHTHSRFFQHRRGEVDTRDLTASWVESGVYAGADANLEHLIAWPDAHSFDRDEPPVMERGSEDHIVNVREFLVDTRDEIVLHCGNRQRAGCDVGAEVVVFTVEQHYESLQGWGSCPIRFQDRASADSVADRRRL